MKTAQKSHLSSIVLILLSFLFFALTLSQLMAYRFDQQQKADIQSIRQAPLSALQSQAFSTLSIYALEYPKNRHFSKPILKLDQQPVQLSKDLFDFYFSPIDHVEKQGQLYLKRFLEPEKLLIITLPQPPIPTPDLLKLALIFLCIYLVYLLLNKVISIKGTEHSPKPLLKESLFILISVLLLSASIYDALSETQGLLEHGVVLILLAALLPLLLLSYFEYRDGNQISSHRVAFYYISPAVLAVFVLVFIPFFYGVVLSFTQKQGQSLSWIGFGHYWDILVTSGLQELKLALGFYFTLAVTVLWTVSNLLLHVSIGLSLALILNQKHLKLKGLYRVLLILPWAVPSYITALVWKGMFHQQYGLINAILKLFHVGEVAWMGGFWQAFASNLITNTWLGFPFMMVVCLGALQSIPKDLYEAATLDGATPRQQLFHITLPLLTPALVPAILLSSVWTFNMFNVIYLVSAGKPGGKTDILITQAYRIAFEQDKHGYAAAYSMLIFLILLIYSLYSQKWTKYAEELY